MNQETAARPLADPKEQILRTIVDTIVAFSSLQRKVFVLYHYKGRGVAQIAVETGVGADVVRQLIEQTNRELLHKLRPFRSRLGKEVQC